MRIDHEPSRQAGDYPFSHRIRTRFAETDAMGIVHHAAYLPYLEEARIAYLRAADQPYAELREQGLDIAVLEVQVAYRRPLRFDDEVDVHVAVAAGTRSSFQIGYLLCVADEVRATAVTAHAFVDVQGRPRRIPDLVRNLLADGPDSLATR